MTDTMGPAADVEDRDRVAGATAGTVTEDEVRTSAGTWTTSQATGRPTSKLV